MTNVEVVGVNRRNSVEIDGNECGFSDTCLLAVYDSPNVNDVFDNFQLSIALGILSTFFVFKNRV